MLKIIEAQGPQIDVVTELFLEYAGTLEFDLSFQGFTEEIASLPGEYSSPMGCILLAIKDDDIAGCIALRPLGGNICEMKRLYVRPKFQGQGIGRALATEILNRAADLGYLTVRLDTVPSMTAALRMYRSMGFYPIQPYRLNPIPGTAYLEKNLSSE